MNNTKYIVNSFTGQIEYVQSGGNDADLQISGTNEHSNDALKSSKYQMRYSVPPWEKNSSGGGRHSRHHHHGHHLSDFINQQQPQWHQPFLPGPPMGAHIPQFNGIPFIGQPFNMIPIVVGIPITRKLEITGINVILHGDPKDVEFIRELLLDKAFNPDPSRKPSIISSTNSAEIKNHIRHKK